MASPYQRSIDFAWRDIMRARRARLNGNRRNTVLGLYFAAENRKRALRAYFHARCIYRSL